MPTADAISLAELSSRLTARSERTPPAIASALLSACLHALEQPETSAHGSLSPSSIFVGRDGVVRLRPSDSAELRFHAPEQIRNESLGSHTDVWAAGVLLWELLTGTVLFRGNAADVAEQILVGLVDPPSVTVAELPAALDDVVTKALEPVPAARFSSTSEMALALERAVPPARQRELGAWVDRLVDHAGAEPASPKSLPRVVIAVSMLAAAAVVVTVLALRNRNREEPPLDVPEPGKVTLSLSQSATADASSGATAPSAVGDSVAPAAPSSPSPSSSAERPKSARTAAAPVPPTLPDCATYDPKERIVRYDQECLRRHEKK